jgi:hypothetical protein
VRNAGQLARSKRLKGIWLVGLTAILAYTVFTIQETRQLGEPTIITGYSLLAIMLGLGFYSARKRLSMLPLGRSAVWLSVHAVGGVVAIALFFMHTGSLWPSGFYEQVLAVLFYLVSITGLVGYFLQRMYPHRITETGIEVIYERIPAELAAMREKAEALVVECTEETGSDTLSRSYLETLSWYFRQPRFFWAHALGDPKADHWVRTNCNSVRRYLNDAEGGYLDQIEELAQVKAKIDFHYAAQSIMKRWLLFHVPFSASVLVLALWHLFMLHVYAL